MKQLTNSLPRVFAVHEGCPSELAMRDLRIGHYVYFTFIILSLIKITFMLFNLKVLWHLEKLMADTPMNQNFTSDQYCAYWCSMLKLVTLKNKIISSHDNKNNI